MHVYYEYEDYPSVSYTHEQTASSTSSGTTWSPGLSKSGTTEYITGASATWSTAQGGGLEYISKTQERSELTDNTTQEEVWVDITPVLDEDGNQASDANGDPIPSLTETKTNTYYTTSEATEERSASSSTTQPEAYYDGYSKSTQSKYSQTCHTVSTKATDHADNGYAEDDWEYGCEGQIGLDPPIGDEAISTEEEEDVVIIDTYTKDTCGVAIVVTSFGDGEYEPVGVSENFENDGCWETYDRTIENARVSTTITDIQYITSVGELVEGEGDITHSTTSDDCTLTTWTWKNLERGDDGWATTGDVLLTATSKISDIESKVKKTIIVATTGEIRNQTPPVGDVDMTTVLRVYETKDSESAYVDDDGIDEYVTKTELEQQDAYYSTYSREKPNTFTQTAKNSKEQIASYTYEYEVPAADEEDPPVTKTGTNEHTYATTGSTGSERDVPDFWDDVTDESEDSAHGISIQNGNSLLEGEGPINYTTAEMQVGYLFLSTISAFRDEPQELDVARETLEKMTRWLPQNFYASDDPEVGGFKPYGQLSQTWDYNKDCAGHLYHTTSTTGPYAKPWILNISSVTETERHIDGWYTLEYQTNWTVGEVVNSNAAVLENTPMLKLEENGEKKITSSSKVTYPIDEYGGTETYACNDPDHTGDTVPFSTTSSETAWLSWDTTENGEVNEWVIEDGDNGYRTRPITGGSTSNTQNVTHEGNGTDVISVSHWPVAGYFYEADPDNANDLLECSAWGNKHELVTIKTVWDCSSWTLDPPSRITGEKTISHQSNFDGAMKASGQQVEGWTEDKSTNVFPMRRYAFNDHAENKFGGQWTKQGQDMVSHLIASTFSEYEFQKPHGPSNIAEELSSNFWGTGVPSSIDGQGDYNKEAGNAGETHAGYPAMESPYYLSSDYSLGNSATFPAGAVALNTYFAEEEGGNPHSPTFTDWFGELAFGSHTERVGVSVPLYKTRGERYSFSSFPYWNQLMATYVTDAGLVDKQWTDAWMTDYHHEEGQFMGALSHFVGLLGDLTTVVYGLHSETDTNSPEFGVPCVTKKWKGGGETSAETDYFHEDYQVSFYRPMYVVGEDGKMEIETASETVAFNEDGGVGRDALTHFAMRWDWAQGGLHDELWFAHHSAVIGGHDMDGKTVSQTATIVLGGRESSGYTNTPMDLAAGFPHYYGFELPDYGGQGGSTQDAMCRVSVTSAKSATPWDENKNNFETSTEEYTLATSSESITLDADNANHVSYSANDIRMFSPFKRDSNNYRYPLEAGQIARGMIQEIITTTN